MLATAARIAKSISIDGNTKEVQRRARQWFFMLAVLMEESLEAWRFLVAPYESSATLGVGALPEKENRPTFLLEYSRGSSRCFWGAGSCGSPSGNRLQTNVALMNRSRLPRCAELLLRSCGRCLSYRVTESLVLCAPLPKVHCQPIVGGQPTLLKGLQIWLRTQR